MHSASATGVVVTTTTATAGKLRIPVSIGDITKRVFLGKPLITEDLSSEKLSNPVALGALSPDAISSTAYGTEQILIELLPAAGLAAFALLLPVTGESAPSATGFESFSELRS